MPGKCEVVFDSQYKKKKDPPPTSNLIKPLDLIVSRKYNGHVNVKQHPMELIREIQTENLYRVNNLIQ